MGLVLGFPCKKPIDQVESRGRTDEVQGELARLRKQQDRLLNLHLLEEIDNTTFIKRNTKLRDRIANLTVLLESTDRSHDERG